MMDPRTMLAQLQQQAPYLSPLLDRSLIVDHLTPYAILIINFVAFQLTRTLVDRLAPPSGSSWRLMRLFAHELISTCELCADCAELNVVYEKHGSYAYGASLFLLTYLWMDSFGEAHATPGYLVEDYFVGQGNWVSTAGDAYARFIGQSMAMPLAWRLASLYWRYELVIEHRSIADVANCKSSLNTSTFNGFLIEFACCLLARLAELVGHKLLEREYLGKRLVSATCSFISSLLVVLALELSGGYFNPILAGALEFGCKGIQAHQHALVFWLGPLLGHLLARLIFRHYETRSETPQQAPRGPDHMMDKEIKPALNKNQEQQASPRQTRSSQRRRKSDKLD